MAPTRRRRDEPSTTAARASGAVNGQGHHAAPPTPAACSRIRLVFRDRELELAYRDDADARLLAGGHDLTAGFVLLGVYAASTVYVLHFAGALDGAFLRTCRPLLDAGLALSLVNMLVVAQLARAQAAARRRRQQLERRLAAGAGVGSSPAPSLAPTSTTTNWSSAASTASSHSSATSGASLSLPQQRRLRLLIAAEAEAELRCARRRGQWSLVGRVLDTLPSLLFKPRCISFWDLNWRRAAQSVASDSGAVWLALSTAQRPQASVWRALPWHAAAWLLSAVRLAPEVCRKFEASDYHRALVRRVYARLARGAAAAAGLAGDVADADAAALDASPCSCHLLVGGALFAGGFLLPLWAMWALERRARRRWLAARFGDTGGGGARRSNGAAGSSSSSSSSSPSPDLAPLPAALHLFGLMAALNLTWQAIQAFGAPVCRATAAAPAGADD